MKSRWIYMLTVVLPVAGILLSACASSPACNNKACYDRKLASVDPYKEGEIAVWGTENQEEGGSTAIEQEQEERQERRGPRGREYR